MLTSWPKSSSRNVLYNITLVMQNGTPLNITLATVGYMVICPVMPRLILSIRELYDQDLHGRWQGIDTGFGVVSQPLSNWNVAVTTTAPVEQGLAVETHQAGTSTFVEG